MPEPHLRASDADRAAVATALGEHMAAGRLTVAEFEERVGLAFEAKTYGGLAALTADLPSVDPARRAPEQRRETRPQCAGARGHHQHGLRSAWSAWVRVAVVVLTIWLIASIGSHQWLYPWPVWVIGPWGAVLLSHTLGGRGPRGPHRSQLPT